MVWPANPNYMSMPSTFTSISIWAPRAGPVILLPPYPLFQEVWKAESTLNKGSIYLLIASALAFLVIFLEIRKYNIAFLGKCILISVRSLMQVNDLMLAEPVGSQKWYEPGVRCLTYSLAQSWRENTKRPYALWSKSIISLMVGSAWFCCIVTCLLKFQNIPLNFIISQVISWLILCSKHSCFSKLRHLIWVTCLWSKRSYAVIHCQGPKFKVLFGKVAFNKLSCFLTWL